jgi:oxygen-independent coproporphyrinogen-3 oxidase
MGGSYSQNAKTIEEYKDALDQGRLPIVRGLAMSRDDLIRKSIIMSLMCQGQLDFQTFEAAYLIDFASYFSRELEALDDLATQGLVERDATGIRVTEAGWFLVRAIGMVFDRYLQGDLDRARFSKII